MGMLEADFVDEMYHTRCSCGGRLEIEELASPYPHIRVVCLTCGREDEEVPWEAPDDPRYW